MENLTKAIVALSCLLFVSAGVVYLAWWQMAGPLHAPLAAAVAIAPAPILVTTPQTNANGPVRIMGTLSYYDQQGITVPYLTYAMDGRTQTKALAFTDESVCVTAVEAPCGDALAFIFRAYGAGSVVVEGNVDDESLLVQSIRSAS